MKHYRKNICIYMSVCLLCISATRAADEPPVRFTAAESSDRTIEVRAAEAAADGETVSGVREWQDESPALFDCVLAVRSVAYGNGAGATTRLNHYILIATAAHERFPNSTQLSIHAAYARFYRGDKEGAIMLLIPFVQEVAAEPGIALVLYRIFSQDAYMVREFPNSGPAAGGGIAPSASTFERLGYSRAESGARADLLAAYWATFVDQESAGVGYTKQLQDAASSMDRERRAQASEAWRDLLALYGQDRYATVLKERTIAQYAAEAERSRESYLEAKERRFDQLRVELEPRLAGLSVLEQGDNTIGKIELTFRPLEAGYRKVLAEDHPNLPNRTAVEAALGAKEATVLDLFYRQFVLKTEVDINAEAATIAGGDLDPRLLYLRAVDRLGEEDGEAAIPLLEKWEELQPDEPRATSMLEYAKELRDRHEAAAAEIDVTREQSPE